jgi:ATP-dependent DNA helicase RecG
VNKYANNVVEHPAFLQDSIILEHYGLNELHLPTVQHYRDAFAALQPNHPWNGLELKEFLYKIGGWGKIRDTNTEGLTVAGLLMFSEERIIMEVIPRYFLEYRENNKKNGWSTRLTSQDGTWSGNIYDFYRTVQEYLPNGKSNMALAMKEAFVNMLVHSDYKGDGGVVVEKEKNVFSFANPGVMLVSIEQTLEGGISSLRNPNLFKMFRLLDLCKRAGYGVKNMHDAWKKEEIPAPVFLQDNELEQMIVTIHVPDSLLERKKKVINSVNKKDNSMNKSVNNIDKEVESYNKSGNSVINIDNSYNNGINSFNNGGNYYSKGVYSYNNDGNSMNNDVDSFYKEENTPVIEPLPIIEDIETELWNIAELARKKKRLSPAIMEEIIVKLCKKKPLRLKELADLLERTPDGLRNNYLAKILAKGVLQLKYPDQPNHPKQAYMSAE